MQETPISLTKSNSYYFGILFFSPLFSNLPFLQRDSIWKKYNFGLITQAEVTLLLKQQQPNTFIIRLSSEPRFITISYVSKEVITNSRVAISDGNFIALNTSAVFSSLLELIEHAFELVHLLTPSGQVIDKVELLATEGNQPQNEINIPENYKTLITRPKIHSYLQLSQ